MGKYEFMYLKYYMIYMSVYMRPKVHFYPYKKTGLILDHYNFF